MKTSTISADQANVEQKYKVGPGGSSTTYGVVVQALVTLLAALDGHEEWNIEWDEVVPEYNTEKDKIDFSFKRDGQMVLAAQVKACSTGDRFSPKFIEDTILALETDAQGVERLRLVLVHNGVISDPAISFIKEINNAKLTSSKHPALSNLIRCKEIVVKTYEDTPEELHDEAIVVMSGYIHHVFGCSISRQNIINAVNATFVNSLFNAICRKPMPKAAVNAEISKHILNDALLANTIFNTIDEARASLLKKHQFQDDEAEIRSYISRSVIKPDAQNQSVDFMKWAKSEDGIRSVKFIAGPSGCGKSGILRRLYLDILHDEGFHYLPCYNGFEHGSRYSTGGYKGVFENRDDQKSKSIPDSWVYYMFDGIDNLDSVSLKALLVDISGLTNKDQSSRVRIIISGRPEEFDTSQLGRQTDTVFLEELDIEQKKAFLENHGINPDLGNIELLSEYSIFDLAAIVEFHKDNGRIPESRIETYEYLAARNITKMAPDGNDMSEIGKACLHELVTREKINGTEVFPGRQQTRLIFSHTSIKEYLAAKYLAGNFTNEEILESFTDPIQNRIPPSLKNTFALLLCILADQADRSRFNKFINHLLEKDSASLLVLAVDTALLMPTERHLIIDHFTDASRLERTCMEARYPFASFISRSPSDMEYCIQKAQKATGAARYNLIQLIRIAVFKSPSSAQGQKKMFRIMLFDAIRTNDKAQCISELISIISTFDLTFSSNEIDALTDYVCRGTYPDTIDGMHICDLIKYSVTNISAKSFSILEECYLTILSDNADDNSYDRRCRGANSFASSSMTFFGEIAVPYFSYHPEKLGGFMKEYLVILGSGSRRITGHRPSEFLSQLLPQLYFQGRSTKDMITLAIEICKEEHRRRHWEDETILARIAQSESEKAIPFSCAILEHFALNEEEEALNDHLVKPIIDLLISSEATFGYFMQNLSNRAKDVLFSRLIYETMNLLSAPEPVVGQFPESLQKKIHDTRERSSKFTEEQKLQHEKHVNDMHIAFNDDAMRTLIEEIIAESDENNEDESDFPQRLEAGNCFLSAAYYEFRCKDGKGLLTELFDEDHTHRIMFVLIKYMKARQIPWGQLRTCESDAIVQYVEREIKSFDEKKTTICHATILGALLMQKEITSKLARPSDLSLLSLAKLDWDISRMIGDDTRFSYLLNIFSQHTVSDYLAAHSLELITYSPPLLKSLETYVLTKNPPIAKRGDMKKSIISYTNDHMTKPDHMIFTGDTIKAFDLKLADFDITQLEKGLRYDHKTMKLQQTVAEDLLSTFEFAGSPEDKRAAADILEKLFHRKGITTATKKNIAEHYILLRHDNARINNWYSSLLCRTTIHLSQYVDHFSDNLYFTGNDSLRAAVKLHKATWEKRNADNWHVYDLSINSFRHMVLDDEDSLLAIQEISLLYEETYDPNLLKILESKSQLDIETKIRSIANEESKLQRPTPYSSF